MSAVEPGYVALAIQKACEGMLLSQSRIWERVVGGLEDGEDGHTRKYPSNSCADKSNRCWPMPVLVMTHIDVPPIVMETYRRHQ